MLNKIWLFLLEVWERLYAVQEWVLEKLLNLICDIGYWFLDLVFSVVLGIINAIDFAGVSALQTFTHWGLLPDSAIYFLSQLSFGTCLTMLAAAYGIRLALNLIPASLTRV